MIVFDEDLLDEYLKQDVILDLLYGSEEGRDATFTTHRWLLESLPKRMLFCHMYGDLLGPTDEPKRILDVGGGYSALSRLLLRHHDYTLLDIMVHDSAEDVKEVESGIGKCFWANSDWHQFDLASEYDLIIATDLFPNVDQRLALFVEKYLPCCREMRLLLTYHNEPRLYHVRRVDADEQLCILAWDGEQVRRALAPYVQRIECGNLDVLPSSTASLFSNKRQVCMVRLRGDLSG